MSDLPAPQATDHHVTAAAFTWRRGVVGTFDDHVGAGTIDDAETGEAWYFHCTRIADGTRATAVGDSVSFRVEPGPTGLEAVAVAPDAGAVSPTSVSSAAPG